MRSVNFFSQILAANLLLGAVCASSASAAPGDPIGQAIAVKNDVTAAYEKDRRKLAKDDPVRQEEVIEVGDDSLGELKFKDDTKLALGPGSRMTLDKFVYDPEKTNGSIVVNLLKGTFRFITGLAAKPAYQIKTPSASISVRGTIFDVYIKPNGSTWLLLIEGAVEVCNDAGKCRVLDEPGKFIQVTEAPRPSKRAKGGDGPPPARSWDISSPTKWAALPGRRTTSIETAFPFVPAAPSFDPDPWYSTNDIIIGRFPRHPHYPPSRGEGGGNGGGKGDPKYPTPGKDTGTKPPSQQTPPVILKSDKPPRVRPHHPRNDSPKIEKTERTKPVKVVRNRDRSEPVVRHKPERVREERPKHRDRAERTHVERASKAFVSKPSNARIGSSFSGGGGFGGFGGGGRHR